MSNISANHLSTTPLDVTDRLKYTDVETHYKDTPRNTDAASEQIRGKIGSSGKIQRVYTHPKNRLSGRGLQAHQKRLEKYSNGAKIIKGSLIEEFGAEFAEKVTNTLKSQPKRLRVDLNREVRVKDLPIIRRAIIHHQKMQEKAVNGAKQEILLAVALAHAKVSNLEPHAEEELQSMIDGQRDQGRYRNEVKGLLDSDGYSSEHFERCEENQTDPPTFTAWFKGNKKLVFSNRGNENGELRGKRLRDLFSTARYGNLRALINSTAGTKDDSRIIYAANSVKNSAISQINGLWNKHPRFSVEHAKELWKEFKDTPLTESLTVQDLTALNVDELRVQYEEDEAKAKAEAAKHSGNHTRFSLNSLLHRNWFHHTRR